MVCKVSFESELRQSYHHTKLASLVTASLWFSLHIFDWR